MSNSATITPDQLRTVFLATELGGNTQDLNRFTYAEKGSSTYSFGLLQFDVGKNGPEVQQFLKENGFTDGDIAMLSKHGGLSDKELNGLDAKLQAIPQEKMNQFTCQQLESIVARVDKTIDLVREKNPAAADAIAKSPELQLAIADYDNQFHISDLDRKHPSDHGFVAYLEGKPVTLSGGTVRANDPRAREDIQKFIDATKYGHDKANDKAVESRAERLEGALHKLNLSPSAHTQSHTTGKADDSLKGHSHDTAVQKLQSDLAGLGYIDGKGNPLKADGMFGIDTRHAVEKFQADHHLTVDGKVGPATERTLNASLKEHAKEVAKAPDLADPKNPDHKLYEQALAGVHKIDTEMGRTPDRHSTNLAAALTVAAKAQGLTRIDTVVLSEDGSRTFAAQNTSPLKTIAQVSTAQAVNTPMEKSSIAAQAVQPVATSIFVPHLPPMNQQQATQQTGPNL